MERPNLEKEHRIEAPLSFSNRFALRKWDFVSIIIVTLLVGGWVVVRGKHTSEGLLGRPLRVGIVSWPGYAGGLVANNGLQPNKDSDFWKNYNLLVEFVLIDDETLLRRAFQRGGENGGVDIMWSTVDSLAHQYSDLLKEGVQPRAFLQVDWSRGGDALVASAGIERIEDLKGKSVAVSMSASQWLLEYSLKNSSLTDAERTEIRMTRRQTKGSQEAREQFVNNKVDAAVLWEPDVTEAIGRRAGAHILVDTTAAANLIADVMVAKQEFIQQHPNVIAAFIKGWLLDGTTKAINDPMLAVKVLQEEPDFENLDNDTIHGLLGKVALATLDDNAEMFGMSGRDALFDGLFSEASQLWLKRGYTTEGASPEQARNIEFLSEIHRARRGVTTTKPDCSPEIMTKELAIVFPEGSAELTPKAQHMLDEEASLLIRTYSEARFCVQGISDEGNNSPDAPTLSRARADAVIEYLAARYNRPRSQFMPAGAGSTETGRGGKNVLFIRLKLIKPSNNQQ